MVICFRVGEVEHCYVIPVIEIPVHFPGPGPGPINYPEFIEDAVLVASLQAAAARAHDDGVRDALAAGMKAATEALRRRAGDHVRIREEAG
jgi:hypothetical protein